MAEVSQNSSGFILRNDKLDQKAFELFEALDCDNSETADFFKEKCGELPNNIVIQLRDKRLGNEGRTLMHNAARKGSLAAVLQLIRMGHPVELVDSCISKITPLMDAILNRHIEVAVVLVETGANLYATDINNENCFHYAARGGSSRLLRSIIASGKLPREGCIQLASALTIKRQLPEELAKSPMIKEILRGLRESGYHGKLFSRTNY